MQLPTVLQPSIVQLPPLHIWPRPIKNILLTIALGVVLLSYFLLGSGLIALMVMLFGAMSG